MVKHFCDVCGKEMKRNERSAEWSDYVVGEEGLEFRNTCEVLELCCRCASIIDDTISKLRVDA